MGFDGVLFGVILVVLIELGQLTPPMGLNLFAIQSISDGVRARPHRAGLGAVRRADRRCCASSSISFPQLALWLPAYMKS